MRGSVPLTPTLFKNQLYHFHNHYFKSGVAYQICRLIFPEQPSFKFPQ